MDYKAYVTVNSTPDGKYDEVSNIDISTGESIGFSKTGDKLASYSFIQWRNKKLLGKILTIIDASIIDQRQNKAVKDIIKKEFFTEYGEVCELLVDSSLLLPMSEEVQEVTMDEALGIK